MKCEKKGCDRETSASIVTRTNGIERRPRGGFVIVEGRTREGHFVTMPFEWRCELHAPPHPDYDASFFARFALEFETRFGYRPPTSIATDVGRTLVAGVSNLSPELAAKLKQQWEMVARVETVIELDVPTDIVLIDPD
jgi:hypothetical protein